MGKPGKQQKTAEKAKKSRVTRRQKPYTRSTQGKTKSSSQVASQPGPSVPYTRSTQGKTKRSTQVPSQPGPSVLPQQSSPDLMTLVPSIVTEVLKQLEASGVHSKQQTPVPSIPPTIVDPLMPTISNEPDTDMDTVYNINNNCVEGNSTKVSSSIRTSKVHTGYTQSQEACDTPLQERNQEIPVSDDLTSLRMPIMQTSRTTETNVASPTNGGLNLMGETLKNLLNGTGETPGGIDLLNTVSNNVSNMHAPLQVPLGLSLPHNLKQKIINEKFVEFYSLLQENPSEALTLNLIQNGEGQTVSISSGRQKTKQISDFQTWLKAFEIYVAVYGPHHPSQIPGLMKYSANMRELNDTYGAAAWMYYDNAFRKWRQHNKTYPWGVLYWEFYAKAMAAGFSANQRLLKGTPNNEAFQPFRDANKFKICNWYAYKGQCKFTNCRFRHVCPTCQGRHPLSKCFKQQPNAGFTPNSSTNINKSNNPNRAVSGKPGSQPTNKQSTPQTSSNKTSNSN